MQNAEPMSKDLMFKLRLDANDRERLSALAALYDMSAANVVRMLIKSRHEEVTRKAPPRRDLEEAITAALAVIRAKPAKRAAKKGRR